MKKLMVLATAVLMVAGFFGTASAANTRVTIGAPGTVFTSPVTTGNSVYILSGGPIAQTLGSGASLWAYNQVTGTSTALLNAVAGVSAYSTGAVISGETVFVQLVNPALSGTSILAINGRVGNTPFYSISTTFPPQGDVGGFLNVSGDSSFYTPPITLDPAGTSIYATGPAVGTNGLNIGTGGVSIYAVNVSSSDTVPFSSGLAAIWAAPVVSGNSIYVIGDSFLGGVSLIGYNKASPFVTRAGVSVTVLGTVTPSTKIFPTPAISGNSLFVIDATGGLTAYSRNTLLRETNDFIQFAPATSQVTASPVTNGSFLVVTENSAAGRAGVTVFDLSRPLAGRTGASWWFTWPNTGTTIVATPAISNGVLFTVVTEPLGGRIDRFNLSGKSGRIVSPDFAPITTDVNGTTLGRFDYSSPIITGGKLMVVSNPSPSVVSGPVIYSFDLGAGGNAAWPQFKADAARTGNNTAAAAAPVAAGDDDSGCFISIIK